MQIRTKLSCLFTIFAEKDKDMKAKISQEALQIEICDHDFNRGRLVDLWLTAFSKCLLKNSKVQCKGADRIDSECCLNKHTSRQVLMIKNKTAKFDKFIFRSVNKKTF